ncbi:MAG TPA: hypothetical protein VNJ08_14795 [Bacteriovoracaceae bacterium]|nr:hypothetical protein [Bacteriovoracaceae bacterium]
MRFLTLALILCLTSTSAFAGVEIEVLSDYALAEENDIWKKAKPDQLPKALLSKKQVQDPAGSYSAIFPRSFFQGNNFSVCYMNCGREDLFNVEKGTLKYGTSDHWDIVEQANVYYWLNRYFNFIDERFFYRPASFLKTYTNRDIKNEEGSKKLTNNAFFNPKDQTLSFLPAKNSFFFKLRHGKISRSGFDPSVIIHEASHYFFHQLFPAPINTEIDGLNEGFADYMANILLDNPKVGLVMLHGKAIRDSSALLDNEGHAKVYHPKLEAHSLGERISLALWKTREMAMDKIAFDQIVIDALKELATNPYATIHDFKQLMQARLSSNVSSSKLPMAEMTWEIIFPGHVTKVANFNFLKTPNKAKTFTSFVINQSLPREYALEMGQPENEAHHFTIIRTVSISASQKGILISNEFESASQPYWIVIDTNRSNILGIYHLNGDLVMDKKEIKSLTRLVSQLNSSSQFIPEFLKKAKAFTALYSNSGELKRAYKVIKKSVTEEEVKFNDSSVKGNRITMEVKEKILARVFADLPDIQVISIITIPVQDVQSGLPEVNGATVIGYEISLKGGMKMQVLIDKTGQL